MQKVKNDRSLIFSTLGNVVVFLFIFWCIGILQIKNTSPKPLTEPLIIVSFISFAGSVVISLFYGASCTMDTLNLIHAGKIKIPDIFLPLLMVSGAAFGIAISQNLICLAGNSSKTSLSTMITSNLILLIWHLWLNWTQWKGIKTTGSS